MMVLYAFSAAGRKGMRAEAGVAGGLEEAARA